uniref:Related to bZIP transcription factor n=1 Tax=Panagrellus redivivus TaxID=6233 RepID=A0A7E4UMU9_PANRE
MGLLRKPPNDHATDIIAVSPARVTESNNEHGSLRSSEDARSTGSPNLLDDSGLNASPSVGGDEGQRLTRKIEEYKGRIARNSIKHERELEDYLKLAKTPMDENPQLTRVKQHFERRNKKYNQEMETLQRKLQDAETRLSEYERGLPPPENRHGVLHNVGSGIRRTGNNIKGTVLSAPRDFAHMVMKKSLLSGSAENIPTSVESSLPVNQSVSGSNRQGASSPTMTRRQTSGGQNEESRSSPEPATDALGNLTDRPAVSNNSATRNHRNTVASAEHAVKLAKEMEGLKHRCDHLEKTNTDLTTDLNAVRSDLAHAMFLLSKQDQFMNDTMEVHQNEMRQLKNDLQHIGTRMDYQYNDRFKRIEESIETNHNHIFRIEANVKESAENLGKHSVWNGLMLSGANIIVEALKIVLYFIAVVLDMIKPITGTRKRAGFLLLFVCLAFVFYNYLGDTGIDIFRRLSKSKSVDAATVTAPIDPTPTSEKD